jgi:hypothetical protein
VEVSFSAKRNWWREGVLTAPFIGLGEERRGRAVKGNSSRWRWSLNVMMSMVSNFEKAPRGGEWRGGTGRQSRVGAGA